MRLAQRVEGIKADIKRLYAEDDLPWIVGYSGGKDSTAVLQLVWHAVAEIPAAERAKKIYVISTDTLVENPIVAKWVELSLMRINVESAAQGMGIEAHRLVPKLEDRFWVNLIGKGYPAPRPKFRWCTSRLKINASTEFIRTVASETGEAILFLGTRSAESAARRKSMEKHQGSTRDLLSKNSDARLDRVWVFPPIADWTNDDVWEYIIETENPWGHSNTELFHLYRGASPDAECPLVVDSNTPSCGDSRFGCYVCTMVDKDKSLSAMIKNDDDKKWMLPLAEFREKRLPTDDDFPNRDFRRLDGRIDIFKRGGEPELIHGPYKQAYREKLLQDLLKAQTDIRRNAPPGLETFEIVSLEELEAIRRVWIEEKHEIEDSLPRIYQLATGETYPLDSEERRSIFSPEDLVELREICRSIDDPDDIHYSMLRAMLAVEQSYRGANRRVGIYDELMKALKQHAFLNRDQALEYKLTTREQSWIAEDAALDAFDEGDRADPALVKNGEKA
jgi:DNA sulfur modification protein DndC